RPLTSSMAVYRAWRARCAVATLSTRMVLRNSASSTAGKNGWLFIGGASSAVAGDDGINVMGCSLSGWSRLSADCPGVVSAYGREPATREDARLCPSVGG